MSAILYEFVRGFAYRKIEHPDIHWYTRTLPLAFGLVVGGVFLLLPQQPVLLGKDGLSVMVLSVLATLPGFYFAGLAAVATFSAPNMDALMPAPTPVLNVWIGGVWMPVQLSRRQFLSYLFSYLVAISFTLCVVILLMNAVQPSVMQIKSYLIDKQGIHYAWYGLRGVSILGFSIVLGSMIATTLQGMFFLSERIHQP